MHNISLISHRVAFALALGAIVSAVLYIGLLSGHGAPSAHAQTSDTPTPVLTAEPTANSGSRNREPIDGKTNPPKYPNMDSNLNHIVQQVESGQSTAMAAAASAPLHSEESVAVTLYINEGYVEAISEYLESNDIHRQNIGIDYIEASIPVTLLAKASVQEGVISIRTIIPPEPAQGTVVSEGASVHGALAWHAAGIKGRGVKIGIIDIGFEGFSDLMGTELPSFVEARCFTAFDSPPSSNIADCTRNEDSESRRIHGTAVSEALFDIAPDATYYIAKAISSNNLATTIDWMIEHDVDVINYSVSRRWSGPGNGTSLKTDSPLKTVDAAVSGGIIWVNSAGNAAKKTWFGSQVDLDGDGWLQFDSDIENECNYVGGVLDVGDTVAAQLRWDDSWESATTDLDLYLALLEENGFNDVEVSNEVQSGAEDPLEYVSFEVTVPGRYCLSIRNLSASAPSWIQLQARSGGDLEEHSLGYSIGEPADSANDGLLAVGAAHINDIVNGMFEVEEFSSRGPTLDGRNKPDIVGADNVHSAAFGGAFPGTSQASPHVAGLAALVKQRFPGYTPQQVADYLKNHAEDHGEIGEDNIWGHGFARLLASDAATPVPSPTPPAESCVEAVDADGVNDGSWNSDCESSHPDRSGHYARYYTFSLTESAEVTITLESSTDPYLYLREGVGREGSVLCENDDYGSAVTGLSCRGISSSLDATKDSGMVASLAEGSYTVEATTYDAAATGDFTLTVTIGAATTQPTPDPSPTPVPLPPDYDIKDHACIADDLTNLEGYSFEFERGPDSYEDSGYTGEIGLYWNQWTNEEGDASIACSATQYDSIENARWSGLNYSGIIHIYGANTDILYHAEAPYVSPYIGDDMLALWLSYQFEGEEDFFTATEVRFLDSTTVTITRVFFYFRNSEEYPDLDQAAEIARRVANRVLPMEDTDSASQGTNNATGKPGSLGLVK